MSGTESPRVAVARPLTMAPVPSLQTLLSTHIARRDHMDEFAEMPPLEPATWEQHTEHQRRLINSWPLQGGLFASAVSASASAAATTHVPVAPPAPSVPAAPEPPPAAAVNVRAPPIPTPRRSQRLLARASVATTDEAEDDDTAPPRKKRKVTFAPSSRKKARVSLKKPPPTSKQDDDDQKIAASETVSCCICMCEPEREELSVIDGCDHRFCFSCIGKWADRENTCPLCKSRFSKISRIYPQKPKRGTPSVSNMKRVKQRDQRSDLVSGGAWEGLLASLAASGAVPGSRLGHFIVAARMNNNALSAAQAPHRLRARSNFNLEDTLLGSDDEDDEEDMSSFMDLIVRSALPHQLQLRQPQGTRTRVAASPAASPFAASLAPGMVSSAFDIHHHHHAAAAASMVRTAAAASAVARSYAANIGDQLAGRAASNPLEIVDDDDDDDDVEVVQVTRSG